MKILWRRWSPAMLCALALAASSLLIRPHLGMGINDDWSYTRTAQLFAQTGHFIYNGWASPMLGWQVVFAALLIKLFGFSFDVVRSSTLLIGMAMAFMMQRAYVRAGLNQMNASIGTAAIVFSPLVLPLVFNFMTDVPGLFCIVLCAYACLRAVQAASRGTHLSWIAFAGLSNALGGTDRQIVWLGFLVMVPSALWILRKNRELLLCGLCICAACTGFAVLAMRWLAHQPYAFREELIQKGDIRWFLPNLSSNLVRASWHLGLYLLPILVVFLPALFRKRQSTAKVGQPATAQLVILFVPFCIAYCLMLLSRATYAVLFDRYLLPLLFFCILFGLRYAQNVFSRAVPLICIPLLTVFSAYAIARTHDEFCLARAELSAVTELHAAGIPDTSIDGTFAYNGWARLERAGAVNDARLPGASAATILASYHAAPTCQPLQGYLFPDLISKYTTSLEPQDCAGPTLLAPIEYEQWLAPNRALYIVRVDAHSADKLGTPKLGLFKEE
jgi:hypothetical protein